MLDPLYCSPDNNLSGIQTVSLNGGGYDYPLDELVASSHLVARGKFVGNSGAFIVEPVNGASESVFTDYYFEITDVVRGNATPGDTVSVRLQGGKKGKLSVNNFYDVAPTEGSEAVVFLRQITIPVGYITDEDYYLPTGTTTRSFYFLDADSREPVYKCDTYGREPIVWENEKEDLITLSQSKEIDTSVLREYKLEELSDSIEAGKLTAVEYKEATAEISDSSKYAKRIG